MSVQDLPLVSIVMPCYNDGAYLAEAVASVAAQTYAQIELVLVDDGSDDGQTRQALADVRLGNMQVLHTNHVGPAAARNAAIRAAKGTYILPLDADDMIAPTYVEKAVAVLQSQPEVGVVYCHADLFGAASGPWCLPEYSLKTELLDNCIFVTAMFRRADWQAVGGFCEDFKAGMEDYDFWLSLLGLGREVCQLPETLFHYRIKEKSRTTRFMANEAAVQETYAKLYQRHRDLYMRHIDLYCMELRRSLIEQILINQKQTGLLPVREDPLLMHFYTMRLVHPKRARFFERLLHVKDRLKKLLGRG